MIVSEHLDVPHVAVAVELAVLEVSVNTFKIKMTPPHLVQQLMVPDC